jgi:2-polyprenyl-3-methyl-5-hydroxy-6-metoxy-1,4-benzoquinol methylase
MHNFDQFAEDYVAINDRYASMFRTNTDYFAAYKVSFVARLVGKQFAGRILDFGCGIGLVSNKLVVALPLATVHGVDSSSASIARAKENAPEPSRSRYFESDGELVDGTYDVIILANVLHHIPPAERSSVMARVFALLRPGGRTVVFEHNTWNPVVMRIVKNHPFDRDAVFVPPTETTRLMRNAGLRSSLHFIVFFPGFLKVLQRLEPYLRFVPMGGQYACVGTRPG